MAATKVQRNRDILVAAGVTIDPFLSGIAATSAPPMLDSGVGGKSIFADGAANLRRRTDVDEPLRRLAFNSRIPRD